MPVVANGMSKKLVLRVKTGVDVGGNDVLANMQFSNVKLAAVDTDIFATAGSIGGLTANPLISIQTVLTNELVMQA